MRYRGVVEEGNHGFGACVPDPPGCMAATDSNQEVLQLIREALEFPLDGLEDGGNPAPQPHSWSKSIEMDT